jgi:hypothetical protein
MRRRDRSLLDEIEDDALRSDMPLADTLRKIIALGGKVGSTELRDWASRELRGYDGTGVDLPPYRKPGALILVDFVSGNWQVTNQQISRRQLPDAIREYVEETVPLGQGIGEVEAMVRAAIANGGSLRIPLPHAQDVVPLMNQEAKDPWQRVTTVYWSVFESALEGVIDQIRTTLVELVAEMRAGMPESAEGPSAEVANHAVNVVVNGKGARVNVTAAQASGSGSHQVHVDASEPHGRSRWWALGAVIVGIATVVGALVATAQWQGWFP